MFFCSDLIISVKPLVLILFFLGLHSAPAFGQTQSEYWQSLQNTALENRLHESSGWLKLLNYLPDTTRAGRYRSVILTDSFFMAEDGAENPLAEMLTTIQAFFQFPENHNEHAICKFPARLLWFERQLRLDKRYLPEVNCADYAVWHKNHSISSVSVVFATGYLGNPASYYGHILLKLNSEKKTSNSSLLDTSINFGAIVPDAEDPISYIAKGLFGGYDSGFTHISYYFHTHNYGESEMRDLWEYELDLSSDEVDFLVAHTWELLGKKYTYYFLNKNCAYRMAEILELIDGVHLLSGSELWLAPQEIIQGIAKTSRFGKSLIKRIEYIPSRQSRLYLKYSSLQSSEKELVRDIISDNSLLETSIFSTYELKSQHKVLDTLLDYYQFVDLSEETQYSEQYRTMLSKRYQLPPGVPEYPTVSEFEGPHRGRPASLVSLAGTYNTQKDFGGIFSLRPAYYDELDAEEGHVVNSSLKMATLTLDVFQDMPRIRQFDIVDITSIHSESTSLPGDRNFAWKLNLGIYRQNLLCQDCNVLRFRGDMGYAFPLTPALTITMFAGAAVQDNRNDYNHLFLQSSIHGVLNISERISFKSNVEYRRHLDSVWKGQFVSEQALRYKLTNDYDVRVSYQRNVAEEYALTFGYYF